MDNFDPSRARLSQGQYILLTMPMKVKGAEAAPARVALLSVTELPGLSNKEG
jgi:hypothetical protein